MSELPPLPVVVPPVPLPTIGADRPSLFPVAPPPPPPLAATPLPETPPVTAEVRPHLSSFANEAHEALVGIPADIINGKGSLYDVVTRENRLRGLGVILVCIALFAAVLGLLR